MNLLHVVHSVDPAGGGVIEAVRQLVVAQAAHGHNVEVASLDSSSSEHARAFPCAVYPLGSGKGGYGYAPRLREWIASHRCACDVAILHGLWQYSGFSVWSALRNTECPYVVFPHGMLDPWFKRTYRFKHLKKWIYWNLVERHVLRDARAAIFTSEEERRLAPESFANVDCNATVIGLGTSAAVGNPEADRESFYQQFPELRGKRILLFLGRIHEKKGCDLVIKAFLERSALQVGTDYELVLAGPCSDPSYLATLKKQAGAAPTEKRTPITWAGMLRGALKWGAYHAAEAFVLPSHQENFGLAVIEALACGVPVLISNKVNIWREIDADGAGLVEDDSLEGTSRLLERWVSSGRTAQLSKRAAATACFKKRFEISATAGKLAALLDDVVADRSRQVVVQPALV